MDIYIWEENKAKMKAKRETRWIEERKTNETKRYEAALSLFEGIRVTDNYELFSGQLKAAESKYENISSSKALSFGFVL
jgi:hypothetical protein